MQGEIRPGYKQTEAGVIPEDWDETTLGDFIAIRRGHDLTARQRRRGQVPVMGSAGQNGCHDTALASGPGVVIGRSGASFGQAHYCEVDYWPHNTALYVTDFLGSDPRFVFYFLRAMDFSQHNSGGAQQSLNRNFIAPIEIAVPPPEEQVEIVAALADADAFIAALEGMIAKKRDLKQATMQHLLTGKTRLPGFSGEWEVKRLGDLCTMRSGEGITAKSIDETSAYPCYGGNGLRGYTTRFTHHGRYVLIGRVGALCGNVLLADGKFFASEHAIVVTSFDRVDIGWLAVILDTLRLNRRAESSAQPVLTVSKLLILEVLAPPTKAEQTAIAEILSDMDADLAALQAQAAKARAVREGMMQELLTGRVRLV
jgi:type I restriction enzyme, S subunit